MKFIQIKSLTINVEEIAYIRHAEYLRDDNSFGYKAVIVLKSGTGLTIFDINDDDYNELIRIVMSI